LAKIEVNIINQRNTLFQGDMVIVDWKDGTQSSFIVYCLSEPNKPTRKTLCSLDGGCSLSGYTNLGNITHEQLQERIGLQNKVTIIKRENLHMIIEDMSK
jgi:hypothetical protein